MINIIRIYIFRSFCARAHSKLKYIWNVKKLGKTLANGSTDSIKLHVEKT